jgi:hypothetical protein
MKKGLIVLPILFLLLVSIPFISAQPFQVASFPDPIELDYDDFILFDLDDFFNDWIIAEVSFGDSIAQQTVFITAEQGGNDDIYSTSYLTAGLYAFSDTVFLQLESEQTDFNTDMTITVYDNNLDSDSTTIEFDISGNGNGNGNGNPPTQIASFQNTYELGFNDFEYLLMNDFFSNYDEIEVTFQDTIASQSVFLSNTKGNQPTDEYVTSHLEVYLDSFSNNIALDIISTETELNFEFTVKAINNDGDTSDTFFIDVVDDTPPPNNGNGNGNGVDFESLNSATVGYWAFDENTGTTAFDSTPNEYDGTLLGGVSWTSGIINSGIETATDKGVRTQPPARGSSDFTYSTWIYPTTTGSETDVFAYGSRAGDNRWFLAQNNEQIRFLFRQDGSNSFGDSTGNVLTLNEWNQVILTREGSTANIYVNGVEEGSYSVSNWNIWGTDNLWISGRGDESDLNTIEVGFTGSIDEAALFDRGLSSEEISFLYAQGSPGEDQQYEFSEEETTEPDEPPTQIASFPDPLELQYNQVYDASLNNFFSDYQTIEVTFSDSIEAQSVLVTANKGGSTDSYSTDHLDVNLIPSSNNILLEIISKETDFTTDITVKAINNDGDVQQTFTFNIDDEAETIVETPTQILSIADAQLLINQQYVLGMNEVFTNSDSITVTLEWDDETEIISNLNTEDNDLFTASIANNEFIFIGKEEVEVNAVMRAQNQNGFTNSNEFTLTVLDEELEETGFIKFINQFTGLFPDSSQLTTSQRLGFVVVSMLIASVILAFGMSQSNMGIDRLAIYIIGLVNVLIFFYFIGIGYISIGVLIFLILLIIGIIYLRSRGGS